MVRGEIYWADLTPRSGSEQRGRRPVVITSNDGFNSVPAWRSIIVVPVSTSVHQSKRGPTAIWIPKGTAGIKESSIILCHQVTTLDRAKLMERIGMLPKEVLLEIDQGLQAALAIGEFSELR